jgi:hypothetical protein
MATFLNAAVGIAGAIVGVIVGSGLQFIQMRRLQAWQERTAERVELGAAARNFLSVAWEVATALTEFARFPPAQRSKTGLRELGRKLNDARTRVDLLCGEDVFLATRQYSHQVMGFVDAAERDELPETIDFADATVDSRRLLMNHLRKEMGRRPLLRGRSSEDLATERARAFRAATVPGADASD